MPSFPNDNTDGNASKLDEVNEADKLVHEIVRVRAQAEAPCRAFSVHCGLLKWFTERNMFCIGKISPG